MTIRHIAGRLAFVLAFTGATHIGAGSLAAQFANDPGPLEIGLFGQYTHFDAEAGCPCNWPADGFGFGGRLAWHFDNDFYIEADGATTRTERAIVGGHLRYSTVALRGGYRLGLTADPDISVHAGLGPVHTWYEDDGRWGGSGILGIDWRIADHISIRGDGFADYMPDEENLNLGVRAGLSVRLGNRRSTATVDADTVKITREVEVPAPPPPPPAVAQTTETGVVTTPIYFDFDRYDLRPDGIDVLNAKVPWLLANPELRLRLEGNADDRGTTAYNLSLGMNRASTARDYLIARGVSPNQLEISSFGDTRPRCSEANPSEDCHRVNRRVDFQIVAGGTSLRIPE